MGKIGDGPQRFGFFVVQYRGGDMCLGFFLFLFYFLIRIVYSSDPRKQPTMDTMQVGRTVGPVKILCVGEQGKVHESRTVIKWKKVEME